MSAAAAQYGRRRGPVTYAGVRTGGQRRRPDTHLRVVEPAGTLFDGLGGEPTLDDVLAGAWEGLATRSVVACPVCGDDMAPVYGAGALPTGGRCGGCGSTLS